MKSTFFCLIIFTSFIGCNSSKTLPKVFNKQRTAEIYIVFYLNKSDFSYNFRFLNNSFDTISIVAPDLYNSIGYFRLINEQNIISNRRCATINLDGIKWLQLIPHKEVILSSTINFQQYFCKINPTDFLAFSYQGIYKVNNSTINGRFNFEIQPTTISNLDSVKISKILF